MATTTFDIAGTADVAARSTSTGGGFLSRQIAALRKEHAQRRLRDRLARMDERVLLDIGIAEDEIPRVRAREQFTPRAWADRTAAGKAA